MPVARRLAPASASRSSFSPASSSIGAVIGLIAWFFARGYQTTDDAFIDGHIIQVSARISAEVDGRAFRLTTRR